MKQQYYYSGSPYLATLQGLHRSLFTHGIGFLVGEQGTGKSALCARLRGYLTRKNFKVILIAEAPATPEALSSTLARELDLPVSANLPVLLPELLLSSRDSGENGDSEFVAPILILDKAHLLSDVTLLELSRLAGARIAEQPALRIVLSGEPELAARIAGNPMLEDIGAVLTDFPESQLQLREMNFDETKAFLSDYVQRSKQSSSTITEEQAQSVYKSSKGYPGTALHFAKQIDARGYPLDVSQQVLLDHLARSQIATRSGFQNRALMPVAVVVILASLVYLFQQLGGPDDAAQPVASTPAIGSEVQDVVEQPDTASPFVPAVQELATNISQPVESPSAARNATTIAVEDAQSEEESNREALQAAIEQARVAAQEQLASGQPVTDSGLVLVTAAERGVSADAFALPEFTDVLSDDELAAEPEPDIDQQDPDSQTLTEQTQVTQAEEPTSIEAQAGADSQEEQVEQLAVQTEAEVVDTPALANTVASDAADTADDQESGWQDMIELWVAAWQAQDLESYFSFYHSRFEPRYQNSIAAWRSNRERVIGNANGIQLRAYDFSLVSESAEAIEIHFWLDYRSPSYQDQTRKKIILAPSGDSWLIVEEVNLQVRV